MSFKLGFGCFHTRLVCSILFQNLFFFPLFGFIWAYMNTAIAHSESDRNNWPDCNELCVVSFELERFQFCLSDPILLNSQFQFQVTKVIQSRSVRDFI